MAEESSYNLEEPREPASVLAGTLRDRLSALASDRLRIALALRSQRTGTEFQTLIEALMESGQTVLAEQMRTALARIAAPATIDAVAEAWPAILAVLEAMAALPSGQTPTDGPKGGIGRRLRRFWG